MIKLQKYLNHTAVVYRQIGSVDAAGNILRAAANNWANIGTINGRKLPTKKEDSQQAAEAIGQKRVLAFQFYAPAGTDVAFGDRLTSISTRPTGGTTSGGTVWGTPLTVLEAGPAYVVSVQMATVRGSQFMVLDLEITK